MWAGKLFHIDLNGQHGPRYDQDLRFGSGNIKGAFSWSTCWRTARSAAARPTTGRGTSTSSRRGSRASKGVWDSAAGCMRNYLVFRERAKAFRADPRVAEALAAAKVAELSEPTLGEGETLDSLAVGLLRPGGVGPPRGAHRGA